MCWICVEKYYCHNLFWICDSLKILEGHVMRPGNTPASIKYRNTSRKYIKKRRNDLQSSNYYLIIIFWLQGNKCHDVCRRNHYCGYDQSDLQKQLDIDIRNMAVSMASNLISLNVSSLKSQGYQWYWNIWS